MNFYNEEGRRRAANVAFQARGAARELAMQVARKEQELDELKRQLSQQEHSLLGTKPCSLARAVPLNRQHHLLPS